jgi:HNH endonuclease
MAAHRNPAPEPGDSQYKQDEEWVRMPTVIDADGDKVITFYDEQGRPHTRRVAELILETFIGPRPPGHVVCFKDGDRLNCSLSNLEWAPVDAGSGEAAQAKAIATRRRADAIRQTLEGRRHSDSAELVAEDRLR